VAEGTKRSSKSGAKALSVMIALILLSPAGANAATLPQGGVISVGEGSIVNNGANQLIIKQNTEKLGVNWQSFNVGPDGHVIFDQPGKHSVAMNRVVGSDGSAILGKIDANGQVILINPNGVIFGKDAQVNVGGIVASTLDITDENFKNGKYEFKGGATQGEVINHGTLVAAEGGYVALLGKSVKNNGIIKAKLGTAALAAGNAVTLDFAGDGLVNIQVKESTVNALVDNKGLIHADGGNVLMTARASNALLNTVVNNEGIIQAQTIENRAGKIFLDGGTDSSASGTVIVAGTLDASAPIKGNGGFIETSGTNVIVKDGTKVTTLAKEGKTGDWLIDPTDFTIVSGTAAQTTSKIGATTLKTNLATTNVTLQTSAAGSQSGDINVNADVSWSANTKLTLTAHNMVNIHANITATGASAGLAINAPWEYYISPDVRLRMPGANSTFSVNGINYTMIRTVADLALLSNATNNQRFALVDDIDATATATWNSGAGYIPAGGWDKGIIDGLVLDGFNNTISNLRINLANDYSGLIGYASNATLSNIKLNGAVDGFGYTGMLAGYLENSTVFNVSTSGTVNGTNADGVGGVIGWGENVTLRNLESSADVAGTNNVGGLIGYVIDSDMIYSYYTGWSVRGKDADSDYTGGIAGYSQNSTYEGLLSTGNIIGANFVGGLFGYSKNSTITTATAQGGAISGVQATGGLIGYATGGSLTNSYATGQVDGQTQTGGLIGKSVNLTVNNVYSSGKVTGTTYTGGLVGDLSTGTINQAFSTSNVFGTNWVGGFAGRDVSGAINNAYAGGSVTGTRYVGGFLGSAATSTIKFTYSLGLVTGTQDVGGYSGFGTGNTISESFWDTQLSGRATSVHGLGKTTAQMHAASTFANWNIGTQGGTGEIWRIYDGFTGPLMRFVMPTVTISTNNKTLTYSGHAVTRAELDAGTAYGTSTSDLYTDWYNLTWDSRATNDARYLLGGDTYGGGLAIRNAGTYTADKFYSTQFGYDIVETAPKTIVINKANLNVSATGTNKTYDGTTSAGATFSDNRLGSDSLVIGSASNTFANKNVGNGKTVTVSGITVTGADAGNYNWNTTTTTTANITKAALTVSASGVNKTYDGTTGASVNLSDNRFGSDVLVLSAGTKAFADKNAGSGKTISVNGITVTGADAGNYTWNTSAVASADITKAALAVTAAGVNKTYDGSTNAGATLSDNRIGADNLIITSTGKTFSDKNAGTGKTVTVNGINVTGTDAGNYTWNTTASTTADIAKAALTVTAAGVNKTYDGTTNAGANLSDNRIGSDVLVLGAGSKTFADKNAGLGKTVTVNGITVTGADAGNYTWNTSAVTAADIAKAALTVSAAGVGKTYDGTTGAGATLSDDRVGGDVLVLSAGSQVFADKNAGLGKAITVSGINVTGADAGNYSWNATAFTTADIAKAALLVSAVGANKTYDGTTAAGANLSDNRFGADDLVINSTGKTFADKNAGVGKSITVSGISVTGTDAGNYTWNTSAVTSADIAKAALTVTASGVNKTYDGTTTAGTSLSDNRIGSDVLVFSSGGSSFTDKNAGTGKTITVNGISVSGVDAANYTWNSTAFTTADIAKAALNVTASGINKTYDGTTTAGANLSDNRIGADLLTVSAGSKTFSDKNAGLGKSISVSGINVTGADAVNYTWNTTASTTGDIAKAALNISASGVNKTYDGTTNAGASLADDRISGDDLVLSSTGKAFSDKNAGLGKTITVNGISVTGADAANYTWNTSTVTTADIAKAALNVTASGINKTYDGNTAANITLADDRIGSDVLVLSATGKTFSDKNAGTGKAIAVSGINVTGADANNYTWNSSTVTTADVAKAALNVTASGINKTYDGTTAANANLADNRIGADDLTLSSTGKAFVNKNAGAGKSITVSGISVSGADAGNYTWNTTAVTTADIAKAALTVSASGINKTYDGTTAAGTALSDNRIGADDLVLGAASKTFTDKNAGAGKSIAVNGITVTGADADNYTWNTSTVTTADIAKAALTVSASGVNKTYDGSANAGATLSDNRFGLDDLVLNATSTSFSDKNAGTGKTIAVNGISVTGADAGNYTWNSSAITSASIAKAALTISAAGVNKTYDGTVSAGASLSDNRIGTDDLTLSASGKTFTDKNAGNGKTIIVNGITITGADAGNYTWNTSATTSANIAKASLNVTASGTNKTYDGTTSAWASLSDNRISSDALTISSTNTFADKNAGLGKLITVGGITVTGADSGNYTWNSNTTAIADIAKATLIVKAQNGSKVMGDEDGQMNWNVQSGSLFGSDAITGSLLRHSGESVGQYTINQGTLGAGANYDLSVVPGTYSITAPVLPPVVIPPVVVVPKPPVVTEPPIPPVNVELELAKEVIANVSATSKVQTKSVTGPAATNPLTDYRLINLGMRLPEDQIQSE
jgi:filamentous hemagglutinin family protein